jgi:hypothetical protein
MFIKIKQGIFTPDTSSGGLIVIIDGLVPQTRFSGTDDLRI